MRRRTLIFVGGFLIGFLLFEVVKWKLDMACIFTLYGAP